MPTEILRPIGAGDETSIPTQSPPSTYHWDKVDDETPDELLTRISNGVFWEYKRDLFTLTPPSASGVINSIKIYFRIKHFNGVENAYAKPSQKSGGIVTDGTEVAKPAYPTPGYNLFITYSQTYTTNPATGLPYTRAELTTFQAGVAIHASEGAWATLCTQVYVEVDYDLIGVRLYPKAFTGIYRNINPVTANYRKIKSFTGGG